jgi:hypothetical protein
MDNRVTIRDVIVSCMMPDEIRIHELLEEMLDSQRTPEEVCLGDPVDPGVDPCPPAK